MSLLRRSLLGILAIILTFLLFTFAVNYNALKIIGNADSIKQLLSSSGIYNSIVPSLLEGAANEVTSDINFKDSIVQNAAEKAFTPQFLQAQTEGMIDGVYVWLNGDTPQPQFRADFTEAKVKFANEVAAGVKKRASKLPRCTTFSYQPVDAFSAKCLPYGVTPSDVANDVKREFLKNDEFLKDTQISSDSFKSEENNKSVFEGKFSKAPDYFSKVKVAPYVLGALIILLSAAIIFASQTKLHGIRHVGIIFVTSGLLLLVLAWSINKATTDRLVPNIKLDNASLQGETRTLWTSIIKNGAWIFWYR